MRNIKSWVLGAFLLGVLGGSMSIDTSQSFAQRAEERSYWRHHDGRWSHWDARDRRWYYTDGQHWYSHNGKGWELYRFDRNFGREGFERGRYVPPPPGTQVVVPTHEVYVPR